MKKAVLPLFLFLFSDSAFGQETHGNFSATLEALSRPKNFVARRVSSYDRTGGNKDFLTIPPGGTALLADLKGPGAITHIWVTISCREKGYPRKLILRAWWDGEKAPSIECPIGDFFGTHHGEVTPFSSMPMAIGTKTGYNCFWYMPFSRGAKFTLENLCEEKVRAFYYYIDYRELSRAPETPLRFHAQFKCAFPCQGNRNYTILEARGRGHYVGVTMGIRLRKKGWWGEGDDMIYIDGHKFPYFHGTGSEDYFCGSYCYGDPFHTLFFGMTRRPEKHEKGGLWTVYRFHVADPIPFTSSIRVTIEHGHANGRHDDFSSVAYWYQVEPHVPFPPLPPPDKLLPPPLEPKEREK